MIGYFQLKLRLAPALNTFVIFFATFYANFHCQMLKSLYFSFISGCFSGIPPRGLNWHKPWLPTAQQAHCLQQVNDVAFTVNRTLNKLAPLIPNLHFVDHTAFRCPDVLEFESSPARALTARDGLHLSYKGVYEK